MDAKEERQFIGLMSGKLARDLFGSDQSGCPGGVCPIPTSIPPDPEPKDKG